MSTAPGPAPLLRFEAVSKRFGGTLGPLNPQASLILIQGRTTARRPAASATSVTTQNPAPARKVNDAPSRSHSSPATTLASSMATPLTRLKKP